MTWFTTNLPRSDYKHSKQQQQQQQQQPPQKQHEKQQFLNQLSSIITVSNSMIFYIIFLLILSLCCCFANSHESNYYYYYNSDGDAIQVKNTQSDSDKHDSLLPKDFFSVFSNEIPILNSVENQSLNENNRDQLDYFNTKQNAQTAPNQIPIVKFSPPELNFGEQFIGVPKIQTVNLINIGHDYLRLESISGSTVHFYCSFFTDKLISPGGNTSFDVYYLARELGTTESALFINTNKGIIKYKVNGIGIKNPFKLKPILNARIPINTSFTSQIVLHNPLNVSLQINEIFTSDDDLHIELTNQIKSKQIKINDFKLSSEIWNLKPYETRQIALVHYIGRQANNHTAFICIQTNLNHTFVIPFELEVTKQPGLFSPLTHIDFGDISIYESTSTMSDNLDETNLDYFNSIGATLVNSNQLNKQTKTNEKHIDLYLMTSSKTPIKITDIFSVRNNPALKINYLNNIILPPDTSHLTKVAQITFDPNKSKKSSQNYGKLVVKTNNTNITFQIGFNVDLHKGSIEYEKRKLNYFLIFNETTSTTTNKNIEQINSIDFLNSYSFPIVIYGVHLNEHAQKYFEIDFKGPQLLKPNKLKQVFKLKFLLRKYQNDLKANFTRTINKLNNSPQHHFYTLCSINTNFSSLHIPIHVYDGHLGLKLLNEDNELINDLNLGGLSINSVKEYKLQIDNFNPIDINLDNLQIKNLLNDDKSDNEFKLKFDLKFLYYERLTSDLLSNNDERLQINNTYLNDQIKNNLKIPSFYRMIIGLIIKPSLSYFNSKFIISNKFKYELNLATKYEIKNLQFEFEIVNGALDLISNSNQKLKRIDLSNFPTQFTKYPIQLKSSFDTNLEIQSIEFLNYGNLFTFKWSPMYEQTKKRFGLIQAKNSTIIGNLYFDSRMLCEPNCYIGLNENASPQLYDLWLKSISLKQLKLDGSFVDTFDLDYSLISLFNSRYSDLMNSKSYFTSTIRFQLSYDTVKSNLFSYSFPIKFDFKRPRLSNTNQIIDFPLSQVHTTTSYYNLTLHNPSNSNILTQIMFLNNYPQKKKLLNLLNSEYDLNYSFDYLINEYESVFSLHTPLSHQQFNLDHKQILNKLEHDFKVIPNKDTFVLLLPPNETRTLQIKYKPNRLGHFEDMIIIRNNLTVLDMFVLRGDAGTAELSVNNMTPMRNSLFFDGIQSNVLSDPQSTSDLSNLVIEMTKEDFSNCDSKIPEMTEYDLKLDQISFKSYLEKLSTNEINLHEKKAYRTAYRSKDGILLRNFLVLKNVGTTELFVYSVLFDGEPCYSRGIELTDCGSFSIQPYPNNTYLLEVRYRPDFTMSLVRKSLTITTNIGDLEYLIEVKIPQYMLSTCHDSLPRPEFEEYFYYLGTFLIVVFIFIMLVTSMLDSNTLIRRKPKFYSVITDQQIKELIERKTVSPSDNKKIDIAEIIANNNKQRNKSNDSNLTKTPPSSPRAAKQPQQHQSDLNHRQAAKTQKQNETTKKITHPSVSKKLKDKETESTTITATVSTPAIVKSPIVKQISTPVTLTPNSNETKSNADSLIETRTQQNQLTRTVSLTPKNSPPISHKTNKKSDDTTPTDSPIQKKTKNFSATNENLSATRRNYLAQQNLTKNSNTQTTNKKQQQQQNNKNRLQSTSLNTNKLANMERTDLEDLNNQFKQIQQQNHQQLKEIKDSVGLNKQTNFSYQTTPFNSLPVNPTANTSSSSFNTRNKNKDAYLNILINADRLDKDKSGEFSRSMSILSKRSSSSLSGLDAPEEPISRADTPDYFSINNTQKIDLIDKLYKVSNDSTINQKQPARTSTDDSLLGDEDNYLENYAIISERGSLNTDDKLDSRNSPLSFSSSSIASDIWIIPSKTNESDLFNTTNIQQSLEESYDHLVHDTEIFKKTFHNFSTTTVNNNLDKMDNKFKYNANGKNTNNKRFNNEFNKESPSKFPKKNQNYLKPSISAPSTDTTNNHYDFNSKYYKDNITQSNSIPFTNNNININNNTLNTQFGPIQRPNSYQNANSNNINNNITNNLYVTLPTSTNYSSENDLLNRLNLAQTATSVGALDQLLQLTGEDLRMLNLLAAMQELNNRNSKDIHFMKLNTATPTPTTTTLNSNNNSQSNMKKNDLNSFDQFSLFDLDQEKNKILNHYPFSSGVLIEEETSYWPPIDSNLNTTNTSTTNISTTSTNSTNASSTASNQPWNSVLLNNFDEPSSLTGTSSSAIRNLWSKDTSNDNENTKID